MAILFALISGTSYANTVNQKILSLSEEQRAHMFTDFMRQGGEQCVVVKTFFQGETKDGDLFWNLKCRGGSAWSVMIKNDSKGTTKILQCEIMKKIGNTDCFKKF